MVDQPCRGARKVRGAEVPESYLEAFEGSLDAFVEQMKKVKQSDPIKFEKFKVDLNTLTDKKVGDTICSFEKESIKLVLGDLDDTEKKSVFKWLEDNRYFAFDYEEEPEPDRPVVVTAKEEPKTDKPVVDPVKEELKTDKSAEGSVVKPMTDNEKTEPLVLDPEEPSKTPYLITAVALAVVAAGSAAAYIYMKKK